MNAQDIAASVAFEGKQSLTRFRRPKINFRFMAVSVSVWIVGPVGFWFAVIWVMRRFAR